MLPMQVRRRIGRAGSWGFSEDRDPRGPDETVSGDELKAAAGRPITAHAIRIDMLRRLIGRGAPSPRDAEPRDHAGQISVVIPLYNHARFIEAAIESVLVQGVSVGEVIVVDDGSTDGSGEVVHRLASAEPRLTMWRQPNRGAHSALNAGLLRATGAFIAILNSDDAFAPGRLDAMLGLLDRDETAWMAASGIAFIDDNAAAVENAWHADAMAFAKSAGDFGTALLNGNFLVSTSNFVIRRETLEWVGLFAPLRYGHDLDFVLRLLLRGGTVAMSDTGLLRYRMHGANTISEDHRRVRVDWAMAAGAYLAGLSAETRRRADGFRRLRALLDVLETHRLVQAATLCAAYLLSEAGASLERSAMIRDRDFVTLLSECV